MCLRACVIENWVCVVKAWVHKRTGNSSSHVAWQRRANLLQCTHMVICRLAHILYVLIEFQVLVYSQVQYPDGVCEQHSLQHSRCSAAVLLLLITVLCVGTPSHISLGWWLVHSEWTTCERQQRQFCRLFTASLRRSIRFQKSNVQLYIVCILIVQHKEQWFEHTHLRHTTRTVSEYTRFWSDANGQCTDGTVVVEWCFGKQTAIFIKLC